MQPNFIGIHFTMHASKVSLSEYSSNPKLLRVYVCSNQVISRWYLNHGFHFTAYAVPLRRKQKQILNIMSFSLKLTSKLMILHSSNRHII